MYYNLSHEPWNVGCSRICVLLRYCSYTNSVKIPSRLYEFPSLRGSPDWSNTRVTVYWTETDTDHGSERTVVAQRILSRRRRGSTSSREWREQNPRLNKGRKEPREHPNCMCGDRGRVGEWSYVSRIKKRHCPFYRSLCDRTEKSLSRKNAIFWILFSPPPSKHLSDTRLVGSFPTNPFLVGTHGSQSP